MSAQLSLEDLLTPKPRRIVDGAFDVHVATGDGVTLPVLAESKQEAEVEAATVAGVDADRCLAIPAREGSWVDDLMSAMEESTRRAEEDIQRLRALHAKILGCSVEELDARVAEQEAERRAAMPPKAKTVRRAAKAGKVDRSGDVPMTRLDDRQRELLSLVRVDGQVAVYTGEEHIPDWGALKRVMVALGGRWRTKKGFVFSDDVDLDEVIRLAQETGEILDPRSVGFFPTPDTLANLVAVIADIGPHVRRVLEPSAGKGALVRAVRHRCSFPEIHCVEMLPENVKALELEVNVTAVTQGDFLSMTPERLGLFDVVVMNPPFGGRSDIKHVTHAMRFLAPGGRLVAIMSAGVEFGQTKDVRKFRSLVEAHNGTIERCPDGSFLESGTGVRTVIVSMTA